jgi:hypothetical protein
VTSDISLNSKRFAAFGNIECDVKNPMVLKKLEYENSGHSYSNINKNFLKNAQNLYPTELG